LLILATLSGVLVYKVGIFEGLLIFMVVHGIIHYMVPTRKEKMRGKDVIRRYFEKHKEKSNEIS
jgi:hypothetical protein